MAIEIGPTLRRRREWARLTQQELIEHTGMDRSASYISALETGRTSPTLVELEQLARYFRVGVLELLQEATEDSVRRGTDSGGGVDPGDDRISRLAAALEETDRDLAVGFMELLLKHRSRH